VYLNAESPGLLSYRPNRRHSTQLKTQIRTRRHNKTSSSLNSSSNSIPNTSINLTPLETAQIIPDDSSLMQISFSIETPTTPSFNLSSNIQSSSKIGFATPPILLNSTPSLPSSPLSAQAPSIRLLNSLSTRFMERMIHLPPTSSNNQSGTANSTPLIGGRFVRLSDVASVFAPQLHPSLREAVIKWALPVLLPPTGRVVEGDVPGVGRVQLVPLNSLLEALPLLVDSLKLTL
jgi:hypothetical protein